MVFSETGPYRSFGKLHFKLHLLNGLPKKQTAFLIIYNKVAYVTGQVFGNCSL